MFRGRRFGYAYGYGYAGTSVSRFMVFLCPLLLLFLAIARALPFSPMLIHWLTVLLVIALCMAGAIALLLLCVGPWQNRFAGAWLGVVAGVLAWCMEPVERWSTALARYLF